MAEETENKNGLGVGALIALIVTSCIGSGIFDTTTSLASAASPLGALMGWLVAGIGVLMLVMSLNNLSAKRPDLQAGIFSYARAGYGSLGGFISGWGYWLSCWLGNLAFATLMMSSLGNFFPIFKEGPNGEMSWPAMIGALIVTWGLTFLVLAGFKTASVMNTIFTIAKLIPIAVFIIIAIVSFKAGVFSAHFWQNVAYSVSDSGKLEASNSGMFQQVNGSIVTLMWCFIGIEGASVLGSRAKSLKDARTATLWGFIALVAIYVLASVLPYGMMPRTELAQMGSPAMADILKHTVGDWGATLINVGLIISIFGAWISWTMLPAETLQLMGSTEETLPASLGKLNKNGSPTSALVITAICETVFLFTLPFTSAAYNFAYSLSTVAMFIAYFLVGMYQMKYSREHGEWGQWVIGLITALFELYAMIIGGTGYLMLCSILYVIGFIFYIWDSSKRGRKIGTGEWVAMAIILVIAIISAILSVRMGGIDALGGWVPSFLQ